MIFLVKIMEFDLKFVDMARYGLVLRLHGDLWLRIISKTPLTPRRAIKKSAQHIFFRGGHRQDMVKAGEDGSSNLGIKHNGAPMAGKTKVNVTSAVVSGSQTR